MSSRHLLRSMLPMTMTTVVVIHIQAFTAFASSSQLTPASGQASEPVQVAPVTNTPANAPQIIDQGVQPAIRTTAGSTGQTAASQLETSILAGGASNALVVEIPAADFVRLPTMTVQWVRGSSGRTDQSAEVRAKRPKPDNDAKTVLTLWIPSPPYWWPVYQHAHVKVVADTSGSGEVHRGRVLFDSTVRVSVRWFPLLLTFLVVGFIYPGCAMIAWRAERRREHREPSRRGFWTLKPRTLSKKLDPVQITADMWGRASLPKLQIFAFSLIVFGLLFYFQMRYGILSGLSSDLLLLLGISGVGTAGARFTHNAKRRLDFDHRAWLVTQGWLSEKGAEKRTRTSDVADEAKWAHLITAIDDKEFDIYAFQMAIFSVVVAVSLLSTSVMGLATFEIPEEILALLGMSQAIFIGGKAIQKSPYIELDDKIGSILDHEKNYQEAVAKILVEPKDTEAKALAMKERDAFKTDVEHAAQMFWELYRGVLDCSKPAALVKATDLEPRFDSPRGLNVIEAAAIG